jgi:hypothetical protein
MMEDGADPDREARSLTESVLDQLPDGVEQLTDRVVTAAAKAAADGAPKTKVKRERGRKDNAEPPAPPAPLDEDPDGIWGDEPTSSPPPPSDASESEPPSPSATTDDAPDF